MIFEGLDGSFGSINTVLVWRYKLPLDVFAAQKICDGRRCLVVEDIELWLETLVFKVREDVVEGGDDGWSFTIGDCSDNDGIGGVVVGDKHVLFVFQGHCWESAGEISIRGSIDLVS